MSEGNVQLKLKASLDLDFLRAQVASLGRSLKTTGFSVVATLDTDQIKKDVAKLTKEVKIKVNDSALDGLSDRIDKAQLRLKELQSESSNVVIGVTGRAAVTQKDARKIRADVYRGIMQNGGKILLPVGLRPISQTAVDAFKTDLRQKLGSITVNVQAQLESAAVRKGAKTPAEIDAEVRRGLQAISEMGASRMAGGGAGGVTETARKESLRKSIEDLTVAQLRQVAKQLEVGGASKLRRADLINKIVADASVEMVKKYLDPQAMMRGGDRGQLQKVLDTFARGVFNMLGMDPASVRAKRLPAAIDWPAQVPERRIPIGPSSTGRALPGAAAATMLPGTRLGDQKQLVGDILSPSLKEILRGAANAFADSVRREMNAAVRSVSVRDFGNAIRQIPMLSAAAPQGALPAGRSGGALAVQSELTDFYRVVEVQVRNTFDFIADHHQRSLNNFRRAYQEAIDSYHRRALLGAASQGTRQARVVDLGSGQPMLAGAAGGSPPMLPPAGGSGFRGGGGFVPPGGFPSDGPQGFSRPIRAPQTELPRGYLAAGKMAAGLRDADQYLRQAQVPLAGAIEGLGSEFANATKQVLLYGTAYKALAFFMDLPNQALAAATALQTFRNQLNAVTGSSENASRSFGFIDGLADRFAVPLESVRQGFVRMYASMEPAGFGATEIEGLFTGVSKAAATFGMSKDQVDRVTYALSQMASKGQIMAEELRGQLGDVLPGSFALFAEAAQMSIPEFTKAMEQGRFSGEAMRVVLNNVAILLNTKFASGAEGAAKTLQGALNTMGTGMQRLYESFEPLVNEVAQRVFPLIAEAMADASSGVKAFTAAVRGGNPELQQLSGSARQMYAVMQQLAEIARSIGTVLTGLMPTLAGLGKMIIFALEQLARFVNTPVGGYLANLALQAALVTAALQLMAKVGIFAAVRGLIQLIFQTDAAIWKLKLLIKTSAMAKLGLIGLGAAVVISAIMALNNSLDSTNRKLDEMSKRSRKAAEDIMAMAAAGDVEGVMREEREGRETAQSLERSKKILERVIKDPGSTVTEKEFSDLQSKGLASNLVRRRSGFGAGQVVGSPAQLQANLEAATLGWKEALNKQGEAESNIRTAVQRQQSLQKPVPLEPIPPGEGAGDGADAAAKKALDQAQRDAERLASQQQQLTIANAELENKKDEFTFATRSQLLDDEFEQRKSLVDSFYDYEIAGANEIIGVRLKLEKQLASIRMGAMKTYQDSLRRMEEGRLKIALAERTRTAATAASQIEPSGGAAATGGAIFGDTGRTFNAQGWVHGHFQNMNREALVADTVETVMALLSQGVPAELGSGEKFTQGMSQQQIEEIVRRGIASHKKYESGIGAVDIFVPEGTSVPVPVSGVSNMGGSAGVGGNLARGTQLMHLDPRSTSGGALSGTAFSMARREQKTELSVEAAEAEQAELARRLLSTTETEFSKARDAARVAVAEMLGTVMPVEQLKLENQLLEERGRLMLQSIPEEVIQMEEDRFKAMAKGQQIKSGLNAEIELYEFALDAANKAIKAGGPDLEQYEQLAKQLQGTISSLKGELDGITPAFNAFNVELAKSTLQALQNADALKAMQETVETIEQAVEGAMSAYKGFAAEVISGGSLKDAASKMQQALKDQAVTMFLDFALKPMEQFMEDGLKKMFGISSEDEKRKEQIAKLQEQINATELNTNAINANTAAQGGQAPTSPTANVPGVGNTPTSSLFSMGGLGSQAVNAPMAIDIAAFGGASSAIDSLNESVYSMGDAIPSFKDSLGNITDTVHKASEETNAQGATFSEGLGKAVGAIGIAATSVMGIAAGISQIKEGGASNVLGGIGSVLMGIGGGIGGFGKLFGANGGVAAGGWKPFPVSAFANGGVVNGPTLGLVGEGKYNEAIVPLPDGRSIPVKMAGSSSRDLINNQSSSQSSSPVLSMSFETTRFGDVDYVNVEQLQRAMEETRRVAVRDGASRGASTALDRLQNSPAARRKIGLR
jgi:tape measure domain-containing protein